jgi:hypothetical protein
MFYGCLFNMQVTRSKNKWKCTLKDGIMHLNNRDILFVKVCILPLESQTGWLGPDTMLCNKKMRSYRDGGVICNCHGCM